MKPLPPFVVEMLAAPPHAGEGVLSGVCAGICMEIICGKSWIKAEATERERTDARLQGKIRAVHLQHKDGYDAPRIQEELAAQGDHHGCKRIARLMKEAGIRGRDSRRFVPCTTQSDHDQPIASNTLGKRRCRFDLAEVSNWIKQVYDARRLGKEGGR